VEQNLLIVEESWSHSDTPHSVGLLRTSDQPDADTLPGNTQHSQETDTHGPGRIRTHNPSKWAATDTHTLDRAANVIGNSVLRWTIKSGKKLLSFPLDVFFVPRHCWCLVRGGGGSPDNTQCHTPFRRSPLDEGSDRRRDLYLTTHNNPRMQAPMPPAVFETTISARQRPQG
jgi:hypothetical protein